MNRLLSTHLILLFTLVLYGTSFSNSSTQTYTGTVPLGGNTSADECSAAMVFSIPAGSTVDSIRTSYAISASGSGYRSDARSLISCTEGSAESGYTNGTLTGTGVEFYNRLISPLFTGVTATGTLTFTLYAWDSYNAAASCAGGNDLQVDNSTWSITVYYTPPPTPFSYTSSTTTQNNTSTVAYCTTDQEIIGIELEITGNSGSFDITEFQLNMNGTSAITDATTIRIYYTGTSSTFSPVGLFGTAVPSAGTLTITSAQALAEGTNYFWVAYDMVGNTYAGGNSMDAECTQITVDGVNYTPTITNPGTGRTAESCQTYPGNVSGGIKLWLKANKIPIADGNLATLWQDDSGNSNDAAQVDAARQPFFRDNPTNNLNFNPIVDFIRDDPTPANNDRLDFNTPTHNTQNIFLVFATTQINTTSSYHYDYPLLYGGDVNSSIVAGESDFAIGLGDWLATGNKLSLGGGGDSDWTYPSSTVISTGLPVILTLDRTDVTNGNMELAWRKNGLLSGTHDEVLPLCADPMPSMSALGCHPTTQTSSYDGGISEVVVYDGVLTTINKNKIESYLAIKYGVTLDQSSPQDYTLADGTVAWDASVVGTTYNNDIAGISRDDLSAQDQKQSKSVNSGSLVTMGLGTIAATNSANGNTFAADGQTMLWSNDAAAVSWVVPETPVGLAAKLQREWYVEENNGDVGTVTIEVPDADLPPTGANFVHLLIDADGDFSTGAVIVPMTLTAGIWSITANFTDDYYFSFGINATPLPIELVTFTAHRTEDKVKLEWATASELNNNYFSIERSVDGVLWEEILRQDGAGNSNDLLFYSDLDNAPFSGLSYYRLKQTDFDGKTSHSQVESVNFDATQLSIYPNPARGLLIIEGEEDEIENVKIINVLGQDITFKTETLNHSKTQMELDISGLPRGVYTIVSPSTINKVIIK
ncbi:MAG: T9SS type A sorting domain-containing protein [Crocinitomicaceae bacterium]|nr:T9SS type A sorting domain-containing protein [Crocinitomicaceae bacterium]